MQPYNRDLLLKMFDLNIRMIDYEVITEASGRRLIGFGRYAGVVGCYNGFLAYGQKNQSYTLKPANQCEDRVELEGELKKVQLPKNFKVVLTGYGRVGRGALEIVEQLGLKKVDPSAFLTETFDEPVYTHINVESYNARDDQQPFDRKAFYADPSGHHSTFMRFAEVADMYVACHYWKVVHHSSSPEKTCATRMERKVVADISCDIDGPVACTLRPSTIADPL